MTKGPGAQRLTEPVGHLGCIHSPSLTTGSEEGGYLIGNPTGSTGPCRKWAPHRPRQTSPSPQKPLLTDLHTSTHSERSGFSRPAGRTEYLLAVPVYSRTHKATHSQLAQVKGCCSPLKRDRPGVSRQSIPGAPHCTSYLWEAPPHPCHLVHTADGLSSAPSGTGCP